MDEGSVNFMAISSDDRRIYWSLNYYEAKFFVDCSFDLFGVQAELFESRGMGYYIFM